MDTRFLPLPEKTAIPIYPALGSFTLPPIRDYRYRLRSQIAGLFEADTSQILLAGSASKALCSYLTEKNKHRLAPLRIALPAYMCISMAQAITSAGCLPVFIDLDASLQIKAESIEFMVEQACSYIVWPNYFGPRTRSKVIAQKLHKAGILIIADEAQSFPFGVETIRAFTNQYAQLALFSFGPSKPLAGIGGGGIYMPKPDAEFSKLVQSPTVIRPQASNYRKQFIASIRQHLVWHHPRIARHTGFAQERGDDVVEFLETTSRTISFSPITNTQAYVALHNLRQATNPQTIARHEHYLSKLRTSLTTSQPTAWRFLENIEGAAAIVAIYLPHAKRRGIFELLASGGMQATWYFMPLNELPRYKSYPSEDTWQTREIAENIAIVAFQWRHGAREKQRAISILSRAIKSQPST